MPQIVIMASKQFAKSDGRQYRTTEPATYRLIAYRTTAVLYLGTGHTTPFGTHLRILLHKLQTTPPSPIFGPCFPAFELEIAQDLGYNPSKKYLPNVR